jgi:hypothetical protein
VEEQFFRINVSDDREVEVHMAKPLVPGPRRLEVEIAIAELKKYKSPGTDQITAELIEAGGDTLLSEIHKLINFVWKKKELPEQWSILLYQFTRRMVKLTEVNIVG